LSEQSSYRVYIALVKINLGIKRALSSFLLVLNRAETCSFEYKYGLSEVREKGARSVRDLIILNIT
jgi:hypothetical protein